MPINVFLADDHAIVRDGLKRVLEETGDFAIVGEAGDGREAVRQVRQLEPNVVIMDISMPELNGIEATAQVREEFPDINVVILSMHATSEHIYRAMKAGALGYLLKESAGKEVVDAVKSVALGKRYLSQKIEDTMFDDYIHRREEPPEKSPLESLSSREREILQLVVEGKSSAEIAKLVYLSPKTVETYRSRLMQKLEIKDVPTLVKFAIEHGITTS